MNNNPPPYWFKKLFEWFCDPLFLEELQGDLEEAYHENLTKLGTKKANQIYKAEVLKMIRPSVIKNLSYHSKFNHFVMFKNYFKTSIRSLMKNPLSSFINLTGLSSAIGVCIFGYGFTQFTYRTDQFHENRDKVYLVTFFADRDGQEQQIGLAPRPLAKMLNEDFSEIEATCRVENRKVVVKNGSNTFHETLRYVDPSFLKMFTFPLKWGNSNSLADLNSIIISEEMSVKYFGDENPLGQDVLVKFDKEKRKTFHVTGVARAFPTEKSLGFNFLINYENLKISEPGYDPSDWGQTVHATLVQLYEPGDLPIVKQGMTKYKDLQNAVESDWKITGFGFEPLSTIHYKSQHVRDDIFYSSHDNYDTFIFIFVICAFLLALACFNYINIAIVTSAIRLKEISLRKVVGASKAMITTQFLSENIFLTGIAALIGLVLGTQVFIPWFEGLFSFSMGFSFGDWKLYVLLVAIVLVTGIVSGLYPALYIAKFQVISIMKGSLKFGQKNAITKVLLGFQLVLSCLLITTGVMFTQNHRYISDRSWGYDNKNTIYAKVPDYAAYEKLSAAMRQHPDVVSVSGSVDHVGKAGQNVIIMRPEREYEVVQLSVGSNYLETMGIEIKEGRGFQLDHESDRGAIVVNELLAGNLGLKQPIGEVIKIDSIRYQIIGVVKDFHNNSFSNPLAPTMVRLAEDNDFKYLTLKVREGKQIETYVDLQTQWTSIFPEDPFEGGHQEDVWGYYFTEIANHGRFWTSIAFIAVLLAALGIYGLVTLNVSGRRQEFSIRKVLGAKPENIGKSIVREYLALYTLSILVGAPMSYYAIDFILGFAYKYRVPMNVSGVLIAIAILISILICVVVFQVIKLSKSNPVLGLRAE